MTYINVKFDEETKAYQSQPGVYGFQYPDEENIILLTGTRIIKVLHWLGGNDKIAIYDLKTKTILWVEKEIVKCQHPYIQ